MLSHNFEGWFSRIFVPYVQKVCFGHKIILTYDGHNSHITYNTAKMALDNNITLLCLPPHSSHALQPLDVGVFKSVKATWRTLVSEHYSQTKFKLTKENFPAVLNKLWKSLKGDLLVSGFRQSGLHPFNRRAVDGKILQAAGTDPIATGGTGQRVLSKRSSDKIMIDSIKGVVTVALDQIIDASAPATVIRRKRVQAVTGEVLNAEDVIERLQRDEAEKVAK